MRVVLSRWYSTNTIVHEKCSECVYENAKFVYENLLFRIFASMMCAQTSEPYSHTPCNGNISRTLLKWNYIPYDYISERDRLIPVRHPTISWHEAPAKWQQKFQNKHTQSSAQNKTAPAIMIFCSEFGNSLSYVWLLVRGVGPPNTEKPHPWQHSQSDLLYSFSFFCCLFYAKQQPAPSFSVSWRCRCYVCAGARCSRESRHIFQMRINILRSWLKECFGFTRLLVLAALPLQE